jgi:SAM-dependent methyltransferase
VVRRSQLIPWRVAGRITDAQSSADDVVQATGWVFANGIRAPSTLAEFVASGDDEVPLFLDTFGIAGEHDAARSLVEIGSGIGRMTCGLTRRYGLVYACDLDAGFLERCREAVARFGRLERLRTVPVPDGRTLDLPDGLADVAFSYITLQHCSRDDALSLAAEAVRVLRPGGVVALNFRGHSWFDAVLLPLAGGMRGLLRIPVVGEWLSRHRTTTRLAWQANRMDPHQVLEPLADDLDAVAIWRNPRRNSPMWGTGDARREYFEAVNPAHWWLVATKREQQPDADRS